VASALLRHHQLDISEPMVFGLASGLAFAYLPLIKINGLPLMAYRMPPRMILKILSWRVPGLKIRFEKFRDPLAGVRRLNEKLEAGEIVGLQTSVFFLPYFPNDMRFHFNAHNLLIFGRQGDRYQVSDPVFSHVVDISAADLQKARFAKGALAPKGMMYYLETFPQQIDLEKLIPKAIRFTAKANSRRNPLPISGPHGIYRVAKRIEKLRDDDPRYARLFLGHIVRMQEEIGTGGGGFRFMYAAFLQEAAELLGLHELKEMAREMMVIGDEWREFALLAARVNKQRGERNFPEIAGKLRSIADHEEALYAELLAMFPR
jgi:hypothetical protein